MRRGPKGNSPEQQKAKGERRPSRTVVDLYPDHASRPDPEKIPAPAWLTPTAKRIWNEKVDRYRQRNQKIAGFETSLAQYCALEDELIEIYKVGKGGPPTSMINTYRMFCAEFYDTPASQKVPAAGGGNAKNRWGRNGAKPPA